MSSSLSLGAIRQVPYMGVIRVLHEAGKLGWSMTDPDWINLGQGQPDPGELEGAPPRLGSITLDPTDHAYGPLEGLPELRARIAEDYNRRFRIGKASKYGPENVAIAQTLHTATGDPRHGQEQVYSDWSAFYRWLVPMLFYWWTQCAVLHSGGCVADAGTFFGSSASPGLANRCMNVLLWFWSIMVLIVLDQVTTWDVTANGGAGGPCEPGSSFMFAHCGYNDAATDGHMPPHIQRLADAIVAGIPTHHAVGWDRLDTARKWRQRRFNKARENGLPMRDCIWNSIPYVFAGFFDDSQQSGAACFVQIIIGCVLRITELTGVKLSSPKLVWAKPGLVGSVTLLRAEPTLVSHLAWTFTKDDLDGVSVPRRKS